MSSNKYLEVYAIRYPDVHLDKPVAQVLQFFWVPFRKITKRKKNIFMNFLKKRINTTLKKVPYELKLMEIETG